jgi:HlyD family secretion protein
MVKKGYMDQNDLEFAYSTMKKAQVEVDAKKEELRVLVDYDKPRKIAELEHKAEESIRDRERVESKSNIAIKKTTSEFESRKLGLEAARQNVKFWEDQQAKCKLIAPQTGEVVYANEKARDYGDDRYAIRVGNGIYSGSPIIRLPDMSQFKVDAKVFESLYSRLKMDQAATVTIDSYPKEQLRGKVIKISSVPSEDSFWNPGKKYDVEIILDKIDKPELRLRPSMSCTFTIYCTRLENVIQLPIQTVVEINDKAYVWVVHEKEAIRREVVIGDSNDTNIEIKDGVAVSEQVVLNPRTTFADEINHLEPKKKDETKIELKPEPRK